MMITVDNKDVIAEMVTGGGGGATWVLGAYKWEATDSNLYCVAGGGGGENDTSNASSVTSITVENAGIVQNPLVTNWSSNQSLGNTNNGRWWGGSYGIIGEHFNGRLTYQVGGSPYDSTLCGGKCWPIVGPVGVWRRGNGTGDEGGGGGYVGGNSSQDYLNEGGHGGSSRNTAMKYCLQIIVE